MFLNKIRYIFCVPDTKFVSATNVALAGKRGNICVGNNVSSFARAFRVIPVSSDNCMFFTLKLTMNLKLLTHEILLFLA